MNAVWKYELLIDDEVVVEMPEGAEIVHVGVQNPVNISNALQTTYDFATHEVIAFAQSFMP